MNTPKHTEVFINAMKRVNPRIKLPTLEEERAFYKQMRPGNQSGAIEARVVEDSIYRDHLSGEDRRLTTLELLYHRFIHAELMTHRVFSRSAQSSRAYPTLALIEMVETRPWLPVLFSSRTSGMGHVKPHPDQQNCADQYAEARLPVCEIAREMLEKPGVHKQQVNRLLEPWLPIRVVVTATEWYNFLSLRLSIANAQPEIVVLAQKIRDAMVESKPKALSAGYRDWHLPYVSEDERGILTLESQKKVSAARCSRVSGKNFDGTVNIHDDVLQADTLLMDAHWSPFEHQATPDAKAKGNLMGWRQYRQDIDNTSKQFVEKAPIVPHSQGTEGYAQV